MEQALSPRRKGSCHQPTNTTPRSSGDHRACATAGLVPQPQADPPPALPLHLILTWPGERCSGTPSSTETLLPSRSRTQRTGTLRVLSVSPQSSWYTNCLPCGTAPSASQLAASDMGLCAWHARGVYGMLMGCTACSWGARRAHGACGMIIACTARSQGAQHTHGVHSTLIGCTVCSWGMCCAHSVHGTLIGCTACSWGTWHPPPHPPPPPLAWLLLAHPRGRGAVVWAGSSLPRRAAVSPSGTRPDRRRALAQ